MGSPASAEQLTHLHDASRAIALGAAIMLPESDERFPHHIAVAAVDVYTGNLLQRVVRRGGERIGGFRTEIHRRNQKFSDPEVRGSFLSRQHDVLDGQFIVQQHNFGRPTVTGMLKDTSVALRYPYLSSGTGEAIAGVQETTDGQLAAIEYHEMRSVSEGRLDSEEYRQRLDAAQRYADIVLQTMRNHGRSFTTLESVDRLWQKSMDGQDGKRKRVYISPRKKRHALRAAA